MLRLTPSCAKFPISFSKTQTADRPSAWYQRASRALRTNQPSPSGTTPCSVSGSRASGTINGRLPQTRDPAQRGRHPSRAGEAPRAPFDLVCRTLEVDGEALAGGDDLAAGDPDVADEPARRRPDEVRDEIALVHD